jgi:anaerobic ribonucleoside-triphosphate reductase activating protein
MIPSYHRFSRKFDREGKMELRINSIDFSGSIVDGPGIRTVLYVQGCNQRCEGCHNPGTWDVNGGRLVSVADLANEIRSKSMNKNLTISGGEPLQQIGPVIELAKLLEDFNITLYTGLNLEDVPVELRKYLDYLKIGKYDKNLRSSIVHYMGSTNQRFIDLGRVRK